jgi:uncharacterized sporulation protein YeaH/YhbH (DUF444 family)
MSKQKTTSRRLISSAPTEPSVQDLLDEVNNVNVNVTGVLAEMVKINTKIDKL